MFTERNVFPAMGVCNQITRAITLVVGYASTENDEDDKEEKKRRGSKSAGTVTSTNYYGSTKVPAGTAGPSTTTSTTTTVTTTTSRPQGRLGPVASASAGLDSLMTSAPPVTIVPGTGVRKSSSAGCSVTLSGGRITSATSPTRKCSVPAQPAPRKKSMVDGAGNMGPRLSVISITSSVQRKPLLLFFPQPVNALSFCSDFQKFNWLDIRCCCA